MSVLAECKSIHSWQTRRNFLPAGDRLSPHFFSYWLLFYVAHFAAIKGAHIAPCHIIVVAGKARGKVSGKARKAKEKLTQAATAAP